MTKPFCFLTSSPFPAGPPTDWNPEPWQPSPPLRLPPPRAWSPLLCDSSSRKWIKCWQSRSVLFFWALSLSLMLFCPHCCIYGSVSVYFWCVGGVRSLTCVKLMPHLVSINLSSVKETILKKNHTIMQPIGFLLWLLSLRSFTSNNISSGALMSTAVATGLGWHTWIRACSWWFQGFKGVFVSL